MELLLCHFLEHPVSQNDGRGPYRTVLVVVMGGWVGDGEVICWWGRVIVHQLAPSHCGQFP